MKAKTANEAKRLEDYWAYKPFKHITSLKKKMKRQASKARRSEGKRLSSL